MYFVDSFGNVPAENPANTGWVNVSSHKSYSNSSLTKSVRVTLYIGVVVILVRSMSMCHK
jgi:hypothetical protein